MDELREWLLNKKAERTCESLKQNGFKAVYFPTAIEAREYILSLIPHDAKVGWGGSRTLNELGIFDRLRERNQSLIDAYAAGLSLQEGIQRRREALLADVFLTGTNAITEDGKLVNIDGTGNRIAAMLFGPPTVIVVAGQNKIVRDVPAALQRIKEIAAPMNTKRLHWKTPCSETGKCTDCNGPERMCNATLIIEHKLRATDLHVVIIGEDLGF